VLREGDVSLVWVMVEVKVEAVLGSVAASLSVNWGSAALRPLVRLAPLKIRHN
jgi:hypothetical protein